MNTGINYDTLSYLPDNLFTTKTQKMLKSEFDYDSLSMLIVEKKPDKDVATVKEEVKKVDGVKDVKGKLIDATKYYNKTESSKSETS